MKKLCVAYILGVFTLATLVTACGGGGGGMNGGGGGGGGVGTTISQMVFRTTPTYNVASKHTTTTTAFNWSLTQPAFALTSTVSLTGNYDAFCQVTPADRFTIPQSTEFVLYGLGRWDPTDCGNNWFSSTSDGAPVVGSGQLQNLVVVVSGDLVNTDQPGSGVVKIYTNPGNVFTGITCTISPTGNAGQPGCRDFVNISPVQDAGSVYGTLTVSNGDKFHNIRVFLGKV